MMMSGVAWAQATKPVPLTDADLAKVDASIRASIRALGDSAFTAGLSPRPILDRVLQGKLTGATPAKIVAEAGRMLQNMRVARTALGADATLPDIKAGADALSAGASPASLSEIARAKRGNTALFSSVSLLSDLVTFQVPVDTAVRVVTRLAAAGVRDSDLEAFRRSVQNDIAIGALPSVAATLRVETIILNASAPDASSFQSGPGARPGGVKRIPPEEN
jgi:hypothetical protein